ncbi:MAG TPA: molybdenum cofactor biosynthesis protein [Bacteroidales bacterium]|nr:MAG: hypothetical protein A2X11_15970 [Bacteroidetes bacterium GWE2_42_24]OFY29232.1 MAG: hypothetical protein A2X09_05870 [Bacteroidetes bacterium GWF2_43_11]PKP27938.1 MAG: molybdenum cofactor biosynthesis protein [Bacteroidetes bacterium HGW-Bacteroidetes-22]HBZ66785.1 molybdenum cofactor biosynthesis protein [Bacteroidales bacterium]
MIKCQIITLSDRASSGEYIDTSSVDISGYVKQYFEDKNIEYSIGYTLIPDDADKLRELIYYFTRTTQVEVIFTCGGTGVGPRDITPETVTPLLDKTLPGVMELIRVKYGLTNPKATLSRGIAGIINQTLIFTLPGSPKAGREYCEVIMPLLKHAVDVLKGHKNPNCNH